MSWIVLDNLSTPWNSDGSGAWVVTADAAASRPGASTDNIGMRIVAIGGAPDSPPRFVYRLLAPGLDLRPWQELRLWLRASRIGDGRSVPFYLVLEAASAADPDSFVWARLLPVTRGDTWELHRFWLGDMPAALRQSLGALRLRSLDPTFGFTADVDELIAATPQAVHDVEAALAQRLGKLDLIVDNQTVMVPVVVEVPEAPATSAPPYVLVTPWAVSPPVDAASSGDIIDNFTDQGAYVRPPLRRLVLDYRVDVYAAERAQKVSLLDRILADLGSRAQLSAAGDLFELAPLSLSPVELVVTPPGRTPLFFRVTATMETGVRQFRPRAVPFLVTGAYGGKGEAKAL
jgi:hypothetical protein